MQVRRIDVRAPKVPDGATELRIAFVPSRVGYLKASLRLPGAHAGPRRIAAQRGATSNVLVFPLPSGPFAGPPTLSVFTLGDLPTPALYAYAVGGEVRAAAPSGRPARGPGHDGFDYESVPGATPADVVFSPSDYAKGLVQTQTEEPDPRIQRFRRYFGALEQASNPSLLPSGSRARLHVETVMPTLRRRARTRAVHHRHAPERAPELWLRRPTAALRESVAELSALQLGLIEKFFTVDRRFVLADYEDAFVLFANGKLRSKVIVPPLVGLGFWVTQPSSAFYVFFAEFAYLAIECDVDAGRWLELAPVLTWTQKVYLRAYRPDGVRSPGFEHFTAENFRASRQLSQAALAALRTSLPHGRVREMRGFAGGSALAHMPRFARAEP